MPEGEIIQLISAPYFIATKISAFKRRGGGDYVMSRDIEDIVYVVDGREEIPDETKIQEKPLRGFLAEEIGHLLSDERFLEAIAAHLLSDAASQARAASVVARLEGIVENAKQ